GGVTTANTTREVLVTDIVGNLCLHEAHTYFEGAGYQLTDWKRHLYDDKGHRTGTYGSKWNGPRLMFEFGSEGCEGECCNSTCYDPSTQHCCNGEVRDGAAAEYGC